jgi:6-phosphogluconolactonase/glucosamine-6-phosphate isomerase/deaminase
MTRASEAKLEILADPDALARRMANWLLAAATTKDGVFAIALSGGSTPRRLYERLTEPPYRDEFPWSRSHWFWADERFVPHDDELSNYRMVREALLSRALLRPRSCPVRNPLIPLSEKPKPALPTPDRDHFTWESVASVLFWRLKPRSGKDRPRPYVV